MLVVFPIAFFTGAFLFDLIGFLGKRHFLHALSYYLCIAGIAGAILAAIPGLVDLLFTVPPHSSGRKRGVAHAVMNTFVLLIFCVIVFVRREGFTWPVLVAEAIAVGVMTVAGWKGATLVHRNQIGVDHRYAGAGKWKEQKFKDPQFPLLVADECELARNQMKLLLLGTKRIVLARTENSFVAFDDRCPHRGGSLAGGVMMCGRVHCPWHGSQFDVCSGARLEGPAETGIQVYTTKCEKGKVYLQNF